MLMLMLTPMIAAESSFCARTGHRGRLDGRFERKTSEGMGHGSLGRPDPVRAQRRAQRLVPRADFGVTNLVADQSGQADCVVVVASPAMGAASATSLAST